MPQRIEWKPQVELSRLALLFQLPRRMLRIGQIRHEGTLSALVSQRTRSGPQNIASPGAGGPITIPGSVRWVYLDGADEPTGWVAGTKVDHVRVGEAVVLTVDPYDGYIGKWTPRDRRIPWYRH